MATIEELIERSEQTLVSKRADGRGHRRRGLASLIAEECGVSVRAVQRKMQRDRQKALGFSDADMPDTTSLFMAQIRYVIGDDADDAPEMLRKLATFLRFGNKRAIVAQMYKLADEIDPEGSWGR
ncbi:hypothetical protein [Mesorhizobium sp. M0011]|uniref:hypothetical protein n=1 Tax=Mesorhizobium sp. M0011 TaxID=2956839 RepID=UPI00333E17F8